MKANLGTEYQNNIKIGELVLGQLDQLRIWNDLGTIMGQLDFRSVGPVGPLRQLEFWPSWPMRQLAYLKKKKDWLTPYVSGFTLHKK